jgi:hypothetical protein
MKFSFSQKQMDYKTLEMEATSYIIDQISIFSNQICTHELKSKTTREKEGNRVNEVPGKCKFLPMTVSQFL